MTSTGRTGKKGRETTKRSALRDIRRGASLAGSGSHLGGAISGSGLQVVPFPCSFIRPPGTLRQPLPIDLVSAVILVSSRSGTGGKGFVTFALSAGQLLMTIPKSHAAQCRRLPAPRQTHWISGSGVAEYPAGHVAARGVGLTATGLSTGNPQAFHRFCTKCCDSPANDPYILCSQPLTSPFLQG